MDKMQVCHVTSLHSIDDLRVFHNECVSLSNYYEVVLVAPNVRSQTVENVRIKGISLPHNRIKRILSFRRSLLPVLLDIDATLYHFHDPELMHVGLKLKRKGKKIVFDSHEDVPAQILDKEWIPRCLRWCFSSLYLIYEKSILKRYDSVISVTPSIIQRLSKINKNCYQITNYPRFKEITDKRIWGKNICFAGGISSQWMHENIIKSLNAIDDVTYYLAGFANQEYLDKLKTIQGWNKVSYLGKLKYSEVPLLLQKASAGMALNDYVANVGYKMGSLGNTKLFEYMMAGIPVIATDFILWKGIIEKYQCGICVNPHDISAISDAIKKILNNPDKAKEMGDNGIKAIKEEYNWGTQEKILLDMYNKVLQL